METDESAARILREIRDELREMKETLAARIGGNGASLGARIDATHIELRTMREELRAEIRATNQRLTEYDVRHTQLRELVGVVRHISRQLGLELRLEACERDLADLDGLVS